MWRRLLTVIHQGAAPGRSLMSTIALFQMYALGLLYEVFYVSSVEPEVRWSMLFEVRLLEVR